MKFPLLAAVLIFFTFGSLAQSNDTIPKKGSYLSFGQPVIEDNSMFIEEAFNQDSGIIQHISNLMFANGDIIYTYTQEMPLVKSKHQLSFGLSYNTFKTPEPLRQLGNMKSVTNGLGDLFINYRPQLLGKNDFLMMIPRFTIIIPTGDARYGFGTGGWGGQFNLAATKRISTTLVTHFNAGYTIISKADFYNYDLEGQPILIMEKNLTATNIGASIVWLLNPNFNLFSEYTSTFQQEFQNDGSRITNHNLTINPGFRFAVNINKVQIVPGVGAPIFFSGGQFQNIGAFIYLSIEPSF